MNRVEKAFAKSVVRAHLRDYNSKENENYDINEHQLDKMNDIIAYCQKLETEHNCKIIRYVLEPKYEQGGVEVLFDGEFILGESAGSIEEFAETLKLCDGINITTNPASEDMFQITFFVENLWIPKQ